MTEGVPPEYAFCKRFRRWAKRANALPRRPGGEPDEDEGRSLLIEEVWDFAGSLYVWGTADVLNRVIRCLYDREDKKAVRLLTNLADEELKALRESGDQEEEPGDPE